MSATVVLHPPLPRDAKQRVYWLEPHGSALGLAVAEAARLHDGLVVAVTPGAHAAHTLEADLRVFIAADCDVLHFPDWETLPYDPFPPHPDLVSQRIATLYRLPTTTRGVLVVPAATLMQRLPPRQFIAASALLLSRGQTLDLGAEQRRLHEAGYRSVPRVEAPGEFAVRGALLDVFPMGSAEPYRIELFDREIESIRSFDPTSQRSLHRVERVHLLPAHEFPLTETALRDFRQRLRERFAIDPRHCPIYQDLKQGTTPAGIEYYLPLFFEHTETLFDYLRGEALFVVIGNALDAAASFWQQAEARYASRAHDLERPILPVADLYLSPAQLGARLDCVRRVDVVAEANPVSAADLGTRPAPMLPLDARGKAPAEELRRFVDQYPGRVLIAADSPGRREALLEPLAAAQFAPQLIGSWHEFVAAPSTGSRLLVTVAPLEEGFRLLEPALTVLTERQLLGDRARQERRRRAPLRDPEAVLRDLSELSLGAPIVHVDHGVGRYRGLVKLDVGGSHGEFLAIEYANADKLYVPVTQLHLVSRYLGSAPELAPLHALGGDGWARAKRKAAQKAHDVAAELLALYAERSARAGQALAYDRALYRQFAAAFPFEETPDQLRAIDAVINDLASGKAMDRVVCGDVGFGKTEVALRAAFVAATAGKQVAVLVPTTLLAQQHYRNFRDRFADWPVRVDVISRFRAKAEIDTVLAALREGRIDVLIGTHRLLQPDVRFARLGLVIIDEEHRFGVRQKEALKKLRAEVDVLTLTATPIPRTLNMAMAGLRELSIIATPPEHRLAVKTFVSPWDPALIREAFQRELARGGQVYFVHNQVETIERIARELGALIPEARIAVAHGQMPERVLERVMLDFYRQRYNVLVCTTIIESGIDVPSANTIIIDRADRFGLAQLHQLRGRVGRSHHRAYAYLIVPDRRVLTADAAKRLEAIAALEELGAGFTLATHDLEIRGAGELLGEEQSGQIEEVGFTLYAEMLERAVRALREGGGLAANGEASPIAEIELHVPALIPDEYLPDVNARLTLYKRIAEARDGAALRELQAEMIDRFGALPEPVKNLFQVAALRIEATALGIVRLELGATGGRLRFTAQPRVAPGTVIALIQRQPDVYAFDGPDKLRVRLTLPGAAERIRAAADLLRALSG